MRVLKKYLVLFGIYIFYSLTGFAQNSFNRVYYNTNEYFRYSSCLSKDYINGGYRLISTLNGGIREKNLTSFRRINNYGAVVNEKRGFASATLGMGRALNPTQKIYFSRSFVCDEYTPPFYDFFSTNEEGNTTFTFGYSEGFISDFCQAIQMPDSAYFLFAGSVHYRLNKNGQLQQRIPGMYGVVYASFLNDNNNAILSANYIGNPSLLILQNGGMVITHSVMPALYTKLVQSANTADYYGLSMSGSIHKISSGFIVTDSFYVKKAADFDFRNDTLFVLSDVDSVYMILNNTFQLQHSFTLNKSGFQYRNILVDSSHVLISATHYSHPAQTYGWEHSGVVITKFPLHQGPQYKHDVKLSKLTFQPLALTSISASQYSLVVNVQARVVNKGTLPVNKFMINSFKSTEYNCGNTHFNHQIDSVNIAPGDSLTVNFNCSFSFHEGPSSTNNQIYTGALCLFTTAPNDEPDDDYLNNRACETITVALNEVGLTDYEKLQDVIVFPNPAENTIRISSEKFIKEILLRDCYGRVCLNDTGRSFEATINLQHLSKGVYFLEIITNTGKQIKKVLKN